MKPVRPSAYRLATFAGCLTLLLGGFEAVGLAQAGDTDQAPGVYWTTKPTRVDPKSMELPRVPDRRLSNPYPDILYVPNSVRVPDSVTFRVRGKTYRLQDVDPVPPKKVCGNADTGRWACGLKARLALRSMIAGRQIQCSTSKPSGAEGRLVRCATNLTDIASALVEIGAALARENGPPNLGEASLKARKARAGIWRDPTFFNQSKGDVLER
ncbi:MAG: thermonuclease family protein [Roseibium sp.]|nr:thermonuclease family protein [Roseibium sp.]